MPFLNYKIRGQGLPVIFIHGFCETGEIWDSFVNELSKNFQVITLDLPGFGLSELAKTNSSLQEIGNDLNAWVLEQRLKNPIVLGHSLGGYISLAMVEQMPSLYSAFGLIHSTSRADTDEKRLNRNKVMAFVKEHGVETFVKSFVPGLYHQKDHPSIDFVHQIALKTPESTFLSYTAAMRDRPSNEKLIANFTKPILIVGGEKDSVIDIDSLREQAALNDLVSFHSLPEVGHMGMFEASSQLEEIVSNFVSIVDNTQLGQ
ncbi:MAG: alpha/beta hydrolase [Cyclobacteriaceae bacterium]|nr:alpha/beta hydrolase [Cyclobacteriaceae bacterium]